MSSFIAILTCRSYRWKSPNLGPLVLFCSALMAVVTALVYSLVPKDLYGTIMPTCYTNNKGNVKFRQGSYYAYSYSYMRRALLSGFGQCENERHPTGDKLVPLRQTARKIVNRLHKTIFREVSAEMS